MGSSLVRARRMLRDVRPETPEELHGWIRLVMGFTIPRRALLPGRDAPFAYLQHSFFEDSPGPRDAVVWANRGGGKTQLGAIATLLDMIFKPGIQVRILGGSMEQSSRMYSYLRQILEREEFLDMVSGRVRQRGVRLTNGSAVELLSQSETSVRGHRVQKLRCDEVELFQPEIWQAAQLVTRSAWCGGIYVKGAIECLSTMHRPFGLMADLVNENNKKGAKAGKRIFKWGVIGVLEKCPAARECETCPLYEDCRGLARQGCGHISIDDAIQQKERTGSKTWQAEMMCVRPERKDAVYPEFDQRVHVRSFAERVNEVKRGAGTTWRWIGGMDFGFRSPTIVLFACVNAADELWIVGEYAAREKTIAEHIESIRASDFPGMEWIGIDPAGTARNEHSGTTTAALLRRAGIRPRIRRLSITAGIEAVRARLKSGSGKVRLFVDPRCEVLIESLEKYHYPPGRENAETPVKDGWDHAVDALRYLVINLDREGETVRRREY